MSISSLYRWRDFTFRGNGAGKSAYGYLTTHPDASLKVVALTEEASRVSIPVRKGDDSAVLLAAINQAIADLDATGKLSRISIKYFGKGITRPTAE